MIFKLSIGDKVSILAVITLVPIGIISIIFEDYRYLSIAIIAMLLSMLTLLIYGMVKVKKGKNQMTVYSIGNGDGHIKLKCSRYLTGTIPIKILLDDEEILSMKHNDVAEIRFSTGTHILSIVLAEFKKSKEVISSDETLYIWLKQYTDDPLMIESGNEEDIENNAYVCYRQNIMLAAIGMTIVLVMIPIAIYIGLHVF